MGRSRLVLMYPWGVIHRDQHGLSSFDGNVLSPRQLSRHRPSKTRLHQKPDGGAGYSIVLAQSSRCCNGAYPFARTVSERKCSPRRFSSFRKFSCPSDEVHSPYRHVTSSQQRWTKVSNGGKLFVFCSFDRTQRSISIAAGSVSPPGSVRFTG